MFGYDIETKEQVVFEETSGPMDSPWPMSCHDNRHTGRSPYSTADNPLFEKWRFKADGWIDNGIIIDNDGMLYFGDKERYLYSIYPNGTLYWKYKTEDLLCSTPAIAKGGTIYIGDFRNNFYAFNPEGILNWKFNTGGPMLSSPVIGKDGTIFVGVMGGLGFVFNCPWYDPPPHLKMINTI